MRAISPSASERNADIVSFQGGRLTVRPDGDMSWEAEMVGMDGAILARRVSVQSRALVPDREALVAPRGVYALKIRVRNVLRCLWVLVIP